MVIRPLSAELQQLANTELNETPERVEQDVEHLRDWLRKQQHFRAKTEDQWLVTFLRGCKYKLKRSKEKLDMYYAARTILPEFFKNRDPYSSELQENLKLGLCVPLPTPDSQGHRVFILRPGCCDPYKFDTMMKINYMNMDIALCEDDHAVVAGYICIIDLGDITAYHASRLSAFLVKKTIVCYQEAYPFRPKQIHIINVTKNLDPILNFCMQWVQDDIKSRITIHRNMTSLYKCVNPEILPVDYGGNDKSFQQHADDFKLKVEQHMLWFSDESNYVSNEQLRTTKNRITAQLYGFEGFFRKLQIS